MINRLAKRIALKHIEQNYSQPLRLQPDYGERNAADFLGETGVSVNTGYYGKLKVGPGNQSGVVADDFEANEIESIEIIDDMGLERMAKDHEDSGSYMSRANLKEINDMADFIIDDIGMDELDDWVEDKISHAHSAMSDVARYRGYRDDHPYGEDSFKFAGEEIIDDIGIMADFDKYSRYSKGEKGSKEYEEAKAKGNVPDEFLEYEGSVLSPGDSPDPKIVEQNKEEMGKSAYYEIIDDLEW
jgi:hypothetical protein